MMSHFMVLTLRILKYLFEEDTNQLITQKKKEIILNTITCHAMFRISSLSMDLQHKP